MTESELKSRIIELEAELAVKTNALEQIRAKSNGFEFNSECEEALSSSAPNKVLDGFRDIKEILSRAKGCLEMNEDQDEVGIEIIDEALSKLKELLGE